MTNTPTMPTLLDASYVCRTGRHEECPYRFADGFCGCKCHHRGVVLCRGCGLRIGVDDLAQHAHLDGGEK